MGDRGLSSHGLREQVWAIGAQPAIPAKRNEAPVRCLDFIYNNMIRSCVIAEGGRKELFGLRLFGSKP